MPKIKAVFFDVGNTLMNFDYGVVAKTVPNVAVSNIEKFAPQVWKRLNAEFEARATDGRDIDVLRFIIAGVLEKIGIQPEQAHVEAILAENSTLSLWRKTNSDAMDAVMAARGLGIRTAVISNADGKVEELLTINGWAGAFEFVVDSGIVGVSKPAPGIFEIALNRMGVLPEESLYVGDLPAIDVRGAAAAGLIPVLYDPHDVYATEQRQLEARLATQFHRITDMSQIHGIYA